MKCSGAIAATLALFASTFVFATPRISDAQEGAAPGAVDVTTARALADEGEALAARHQCATAVEKLERAELRAHSASTLAWLGVCQLEVGNFVAGAERLERVLQEELPEASRDKVLGAKVRAREALNKYKEHIARLKVAVYPPPDREPVVTVDGKPLVVGAWNLERVVTPGEHVVEADMAGYRHFRERVKVKEGDTETVILVMDPSGTRFPALALMGAGGASLAIGIGLGIAAASKRDDLESVCGPEKLCPVAQRSNLESAKNTANNASIFVVVGALVGTAGALLFFLPDTPYPWRQTSRAKPASPARATARPWIIPGGAGLEGTF